MAVTVIVEVHLDMEKWLASWKWLPAHATIVGYALTMEVS